MKAIYDSAPDAIQENVDGSVYFRWDVEQISVEFESKTETKYKCNEVLIYNPLTRNKITETVIEEIYPNSVEKKLINDYIAAKDGLLGADRIDAYKSFLTERDRLKSIIKDECIKKGIV